MSGLVAHNLSGLYYWLSGGGWPMRWTEILQEIRKMRFEEAYDVWTEKRLSQGEAARMLGVCDRTFRRYINRYE